MAEAPPRFCLIAHVRPKDPEQYLTYLRETYYPGLRTMPGFRSLRVVRWRVSESDFLRMSTWATREDAENYLSSDLQKSFGVLLEMATVVDFAGADIVIDAGP
jgi:hypothetical protein